MANTRIPGTIIRSGSIPTVALSGGVVSSSIQVISSLPTGSVSSSTQVSELLPTGTVSHSAQVKDYLPTGTVSHSAQVDYLQLQNIPAGIASSSAQVKDYLPVDTVSSSIQVTAFLPAATVSSSGQVDITNTTNYTTFSSSLATVDVGQNARLSSVESATGSYTTTGSNVFVGTQSFTDTTNTTSYLDGAIHIAGGVSIQKDLRVSGSIVVNGLLTAVSMSTQYVTASQYNIGVSKITLNDDDTVRFAGISIYDSGSSSPASASIFWDSLQHRFIYENLSGSAYNSSIIIAGPKHTGSLGDEPTLTSGYIPVATGGDHIDNSVMFQSSSNIGIGTITPSLGTLQINGNVYATSYTGSLTGSSVAANTLTGTLQTAAQTNVTSVGTLTSLTVSGDLTVDTTTLNVDAANDRVHIGSLSTVNSSKLTVLQGGGNVQMTLASSATKYHSFYVDGNGGLFLQPNGSTAANLDASGNLGLGVTPKSWATGWKVIDIGANGSLAYTTAGDNDLTLAINAYYDTTDARWEYKSVTDKAARYSITAAGVHAWYYTNTNGTANGPITFTEAMRINSSGNVGIGTTNPSYLLDVQKSDAGNVVDFRITNTESANAASGTRAIVQTNGASAGDPRLLLSVAGVREYSLGIDNSDSDKFKINDGSDPSSGTNYLTIDTSGNVSLGSSGTSDKLLVYANANSRNKVMIRNDSSGSSARAELVVNAYGNSWGLGMGSSANNSNAFYIRSDSNDTDAVRLSILTSGDIGIANTSPEARLDIIGATQGTITTLGSEVPGLIVQQRLTSDSNGNAGPMIDFRTSNGADVWTQGAIATVAAGTYAGQMAFYTQPGGTTDTTGRRTKGASLVERMRINESGNVGIGTTNPTQKLVISDSSTNGTSVNIVNTSTGGYNWNIFSGGSAETLGPVGSLIFRDSNNGVTRMLISSSGNVGIGTTNATNLLTVRGVSAQVDIQSTADSQVPGIFMRYIDSSTAGAKIYYATGNAVTYYDNLYSYSANTVYGSHDFRSKNSSDVLTSRLFIRGENGNVGIGTTNPGDKLHVVGGIIKSTGTGYDGTYDNVFKYMVTGDVGVNNNRWIGANATITAGGAASNKLDFRVYQGNAAQDQAPLVVMTLQGDGSVGIGTASPSQKLHITGYARMTGYQVWETGGTISAFVGYEKAWTGAGSSNDFAIAAESGNNIKFYTNGSATLRMTLNTSGHLLPGANGTQDLGSSSLRWSTVYTSDLSLSNGIGDWTIVEGEDDLFIYNNKNNKVYKFTLQEVDPSTATPKKS